MHLNKYFQFHFRIVVQYNSLDRHWALMRCKSHHLNPLNSFKTSIALLCLSSLVANWGRRGVEHVLFISQTLFFFPLCRIACGIIARTAGLFQNPKQICACDGVTLWEERDRPIAGKGRSKASTETPAAHLWTNARLAWTEHLPWEMRRMKNRRQSTERYVSRQLQRWPEEKKKNSLFFFFLAWNQIKYSSFCYYVL